MSCLSVSVLTAISRLGTVCNYLFSTRIAELLRLTVSISLNDSATAGGAWHFCVAKVAPVALSTNTVYVNWLSDKRYLCVRINHQIGPLSRTEQKSLWPQAVFRESLTYRIIFISLERWATRQIRICTHKRMGREWQLSRPICNGSSNNTPWSFRLATRRGVELVYLIYISVTG